jgi:hypothetical protein
MTQEIIAKLDKLADMQAQADAIRLHYEQLKDAVLTPEIKQALADIAAEEATSITAVNSIIEAMTGEIKQAVISEGASVKGTWLQAVYSKPRVSWDTKGLDGYAVAHPEMQAFRTTGQPSVSIRSEKK